ncbi:DUF3995 domain-containing protein [Hyphomonas sp. CACIAM 19H1]|uniref:DUF3995 domain-containing protein n=1 Tax=Hyphomonas sp. CACIAM 19H1 TaxID=1873716 RepID=UPI0013B05C3E|nr:DUF3995 domain-containing protein [Hyphomonas sp. CACIAM 19H1]
MAALLGTLLALVLGCLCALHLIWAAGASFPFPNQQSLARSVVGRRGITRLPSRASVALLGVLLLCGAAAALIMGHYAATFTGLKFLLVPVGLLLSAIFLLRGVVGILPAFERAAPEQPYLTLNRRLYSPLCALIGFGFLALTFSLPNWAWHFSRLVGG